MENSSNTRHGWENSNIAFVAESNIREVVGYIRGLTDGHISLYICELLIDKKYRGLGPGPKDAEYIHGKHPQIRIEILASSSSHTYYEGLGFRAFYGFRKVFGE